MNRVSQMTFLDSSWHNDFSCEMVSTLQVFDFAILVISAKDGIQAHTKTIWKLLQTYQIPTFIFVNKIYSTYSTKEQLLQNIQKEIFTFPVMTANETVIGDLTYIASSSSQYNDTYAAWKAFTGTFAAETDAWQSQVLPTVDAPQWLKI